MHDITDYEYNKIPDPYILSSLLRKAQLSLTRHGVVRLAFLDIDNTLTGATEDDTNDVRHKLRSLDYGMCFVTARTEEALMSETAYTKSKKLGFSRPKPRLKRVEGIHQYIDPQEFEPDGIIDPDVIAGSTGTKILLKQEGNQSVYGAYCEDFDYSEKIGVSSHHFRESVLGFLQLINHEYTVCHVSPVDNEENYHNKVTDVFPPDFRVAINFDSIEAKKHFLQILHHLDRQSHFLTKFFDSELLKNISYTSDGYPKKGKIRGYLAPKKMDKAAAAEQVIQYVTKQLSISRDQIETLFAGDGFPDLAMGFGAGQGTKAKFVLVGGSRLASYLTQKEIMDFAGETLAHIREKLFPTEQKGYYSYQSENYNRQVIIADLAYTNTLGPQSILRAIS